MTEIRQKDECLREYFIFKSGCIKKLALVSVFNLCKCNVFMKRHLERHYLLAL